MKHAQRWPILVLLAAALAGGCSKKDDDDPIAPGPGGTPVTPGALDPAFDGDGILTTNPSPDADEWRAVASDGTSLYLAGFDSNGAGSSWQWRIEKRDLATGALVTSFDGDGIVTSDPSGATDYALAIAIDATSMYVGGYDAAPSAANLEWRIEKRSLATGALVTAFDGDGVVTSDPSVDWDVLNSLVIDGSFLYAVGYQGGGAGPSTQIRIEKRSLSTGALVTAFDTDGVITEDPSNSSDEAREVAVDASYVYIAGMDGNGAGPALQWRIEKRDITTGALVVAFDGDGLLTTDPGAGPDYIESFAIDGSSMYVGGYDQGGSGGRMRIEKRSLTTGALVTAFDGDGILSIDPSADIDFARTLAVDGGSLYIGGQDAAAGGNYRWRIEKRNATSGALDTGFDTDGIVSSDPSLPNDDEVKDLVVVGSFIIVVGWDSADAGVTGECRVEKRGK